ncbi:MAG TPA: glycyl-radical enzyme activating protein, partial [Candidatus Kapabacteria bacterium]|nr:glycyl-radical enzyme activating protein [Candidatus Kapabacteria bacterium]
MKPTSNSPEDNVKGLIFDIQPYSVHDGPGIRTLIFIKGCPLCCKWCSNPESRHLKPQLMYKKELCRPECGKCKDETGAVHNAGKIVSDLSTAPHCPYHATRVSGTEITVNEMMEIIRNDRPFFGETGGITLSGGEPFCQPEFVQVLLEKCKSNGISTAIETSLYASFQIIEKAVLFLDFFMFDIKLMDPVKHFRYCGVDNALILENIQRLTKTAEIPLLPRMPLIPGINDDEENIIKTAQFLKDNHLKHINLLPYMRLGITKYEQLGLEYELHEIIPPNEKEVKRVKDIFSQYDILCL